MKALELENNTYYIMKALLEISDFLHPTVLRNACSYVYLEICTTITELYMI